MVYYLVLGIVIILAFLIFMVQNTGQVWVYFLNLRFLQPLSVVLLVTFLIGVLTSALVAVPFLLRKEPKNEPQKTKIL